LSILWRKRDQKKDKRGENTSEPSGVTNTYYPRRFNTGKIVM